MPRPLILASGSAIRRALLGNAGLDFVVDSPRVDEDAVRGSLEAEGTSPRDQADALAELKARKAAGRHGDAFVVGCDQILELDGKVFAKPEAKDELRDQLARLSGRTHRLHSAVVVYEAAEPVWRHVATAKLTMHELSPEFIASYVDRNWDEVRHCVGGYQLEAEGVRMISRLEGSYHAVLGLPLIELLSYLTQRKVIEI